MGKRLSGCCHDIAVQCSTKVVRTERGTLARLDSRLELRLDKVTFERLERRAAADHTTVAQLVREAIARELQGGGDERWRAQALERGLSLAVPVPQDPADLVRELDAGYETEVAALPASPVRD